MHNACRASHTARALLLVWCAPLGQTHDAAACYRFEEGKGVDKVFSGLVSKARRVPQLQAQHLLVVKKSFRQMLEVR